MPDPERPHGPQPPDDDVDAEDLDRPVHHGLHDAIEHFFGGVGSLFDLLGDAVHDAVDKEPD